MNYKETLCVRKHVGPVCCMLLFGFQGSSPRPANGQGRGAPRGELFNLLRLLPAVNTKIQPPASSFLELHLRIKTPLHCRGPSSLRPRQTTVSLLHCQDGFSVTGKYMGSGNANLKDRSFQSKSSFWCFRAISGGLPRFFRPAHCLRY